MVSRDTTSSPNVPLHAIKPCSMLKWLPIAATSVSVK